MSWSLDLDASHRYFYYSLQFETISSGKGLCPTQKLFHCASVLNCFIIHIARIHTLFPTFSFYTNICIYIVFMYILAKPELWSVYMHVVAFRIYYCTVTKTKFNNFSDAILSNNYFINILSNEIISSEICQKFTKLCTRVFWQRKKFLVSVKSQKLTG